MLIASHSSNTAPNLVSKLPDVGTTIFTVMTQLALEHNAINLAQGFPNFPASEELIENAARAMRDGMNQYAPMPGLKSLREQIARMVYERYGAEYHVESEITVTSGATAALFCAIHAVVLPGDEVLVFEPCYDSYAPAVRLAGGVVKSTKLRFPDYSVDWDDVERQITPRTRLLLFNTPHNPSGAVWSKHDVERLAELVRGRDLFVVSDEVYEHIVFDGEPHESIARHEELRERSFIVSSFGKTFHVTGWKTGYCIAPALLMNEFRKVHQFVTFCTNTPAQIAFARMLENPQNYKELGAFYERKRDRFRSLMNGSRFELLSCRGSYFQLAIYRTLSDEPDADFAVRLTKERGVAVIPVSVFYADGTDNHVVRFCFAKTDETLERAAEILRAL